MPQVLDPFFHQSVVLLVHHETEGSVGFIVNRPTTIRVAEVLQGLEVDWHGEHGERAFFGGPVRPQIGTLLYRPANDEVNLEDSVAPGIAMTQQLDGLATVLAGAPPELRLVLGYAGWGEGQLVEEILRNDWVVAPVNADLVFADDPEAAWRAAFDSVGIDPATLPTWTPDTDGQAN